MFPVRTVRPLTMRGGGATESTAAGYAGPRTHKKLPNGTSPPPAATAASPTTPAGGAKLSNGTASKQSTTPEPPSPRSTITIYTALDDEDDDQGDGGTSLASPLGVAVTANNSTQSGPLSPIANLNAALQSSATTLSPEHHMALYGHGLAAPETEAAVRALGISRNTSFHADPNRSLGRTPDAGTASLRSPLGKSVNGAGGGAALDDEVSQDAGAVRYSATPVVPLHEGSDAHLRHGAALKFQSRIQKAEAETAALAAQAEAERQAKQAAAKAQEEADAKLTKKEREKRDKKDKKAKEKEKKELDKSRPADPRAAPPAQQLTGKALKEYLVRVGIERINQRVSDFHLQMHRVRNDGNCQFRAISHQLFGSESYHDVVRSHVISYMRSVRAEQFDFYFESKAEADQYFNRVSEPGAWGDELTLRGASDSLYVNIHILSSEVKNCFIVYRPSATAPPPPAFLVDVTTLRERRQRERSLGLAAASRPASRVPSRVPSSLRFRTDAGGAATTAGGEPRTPHTGVTKTDSSPGNSNNNSHNNNNEEDEDADAIDAAALQHALEKRLHNASIMTITPCVSDANSLAASFAHSVSFAAPPAPIPAQAPTAHMSPLTPAGGADAAAAMAAMTKEGFDVDKFTKAGATVQDRKTGTDDVSLLLSRPGKASLLPPAPRPPTLHPAVTTTLSAPTVTGGDSTLGSPHLLTPQMPSRSASTSFSMWPPNQGSFTDAHPAFPTAEGGNVLLVAAPRAHRAAEAHGTSPVTASTTVVTDVPASPGTDTAAFAPILPTRGVSTYDPYPPLAEGVSPSVSLHDPRLGGSFNGGSYSAFAGPDLEVGVRFAFEKRTEPIDIFLSYLYPVHYNSIELMENSFASPVVGPAAAPEFPVTASVQGPPPGSPHTNGSQSPVRSPNTISAESGSVSATAVSQRLVTVPFLRPESASP